MKEGAKELLQAHIDYGAACTCVVWILFSRNYRHCRRPALEVISQ